MEHCGDTPPPLHPCVLQVFLFRVALALLKHDATALLKGDLEECVSRLRRVEGLDPDTFMAKVAAVNVSNKKFLTLVQQHTHHRRSASGAPASPV